jgi:hypothetical protein
MGCRGVEVQGCRGEEKLLKSANDFSLSSVRDEPLPV